MANRYWVGGSGNLNDASHWSLSSGGSGGAGIPVTGDSMYFDSNSSAGPFTVTINTAFGVTLANASIKPTHAMSFTSSSPGDGWSFDCTSFEINDKPVFPSQSGSGYIHFWTRGAFILDLDPFNPTTENISVAVRSGSLALARDTTIDSLSGQAGATSFTTNGYTLTASDLYWPGGMNVNITGSTIYYASIWDMSTTAILTSTGSTIYNNYDLAGSTAFRGGGKTYNTLNVYRSTVITGSNIFNTLNISAGRTLQFAASTTQAVTNFNAVGTAFSQITLRSFTSGVKFNLTKSSGLVEGQYLDIKDSNATGGATWNAINSTDSGNNTGWNFTGSTELFADFVGDPTSGIRPLLVDFTDQTTGGPTSWDWDFGDGGTSTLQNPSHTYTSPGSYKVTLDVENDVSSDGVAKFDYITVTVETHTRQAKGTLTFSGDTNPTYTAIREAKGTLTFSGTVFAIRLENPSTIEKKTYLYKVYDENDNFVGVWDDVASEPNWSEELNSAGSSTNVLLARNSDSIVRSSEPLQDHLGASIKDSNNFDILTTAEARTKVGPGSNVSHNYRVDVFVFYGEVGPIQDNTGAAILDSSNETIDGTIGAPNGVRRFSGFIAEINNQYGDSESTQVQLMSYGFDLDQYPVVTAGGNTTVPFNSYDPGNIVQDGLDQFATDGAPEVYTTYTPATVQTSGTIVSYTFRNNTYLELLKKAVELSPVDWYFYVDLGTNFVNFKVKSSTPQHTFFLGKHIKSLALRSYNGDTVNDVIFTGGQTDPEDQQSVLYKRYTRTPNIGTRRGLSRLSDNRVTLESSAEILSEGEMDQKENVQYRSTISILDKTYDIESIRVGDVIGFRNFNNHVDDLTMQVVALDYTPDVVTLQLDTLPDSTNKRLEDIRRNLKLQENENIPVAPS